MGELPIVAHHPPRPQLQHRPGGRHQPRLPPHPGGGEDRVHPAEGRPGLVGGQRGHGERPLHRPRHRRLSRSGRSGRRRLQHRGQLRSQRPRLEQRDGGGQPGQRSRPARLQSRPPCSTSPSATPRRNNDLFILVQDAAQLQSDNLAPYFIKVEVLTDPDANEPNDTPATATPSPPAVPTPPAPRPDSSPRQETWTTSPSTRPNPNSVIWLRVGQDPAFPSPPPHRYRLEYFLYDSTGVRRSPPTPRRPDRSSAPTWCRSAPPGCCEIPAPTPCWCGPTSIPTTRPRFPPETSTSATWWRRSSSPSRTLWRSPGTTRIEDALANPLTLKTLARWAARSPSPGGSASCPIPDFYIVRLNGASADGRTCCTTR